MINPNIRSNTRNNRLFFHLGNFLMLAAVLILGYLYYPIVGTYLFPAKLANYSHTKGMYIQIPKISAQSPLIPNVDPWNESDYLPKLKQGVALAKGYALPGDGGVSYVFAHSDDWPWNITRYNTAFFKLNEIGKGDTIYIFKNGTKLTYTVYDEKTVWPSDVAAVKIKGHNILILQTCTPIGTSFQRLLLYAKEV